MTQGGWGVDGVQNCGKHADIILESSLVRLSLGSFGFLTTNIKSKFGLTRKRIGTTTANTQHHKLNVRIRDNASMTSVYERGVLQMLGGTA